MTRAPYRRRPRAAASGPIGTAARLGALALCGAWIGALASAHTSEMRKPIGPAPLPAREIAGAPEPGGRVADAARSWARNAFDVGLRECPRVTPAFHSACADQMAEEERYAAAAARAAAEFAATFDYQPAYVPEPLYDDLPRPALFESAPRDERRDESAGRVTVARGDAGRPAAYAPRWGRAHPDMDGDPATRAPASEGREGERMAELVPVVVDVPPPAVPVRPPPAVPVRPPPVY